MSFDSPEENAAFATRFQFPYPLLCDVSRSIGLAYGACARADEEWPRRITYLIGPDGRIVHAFEQVKVKEHATEILALLPSP